MKFLKKKKSFFQKKVTFEKIYRENRDYPRKTGVKNPFATVFDLRNTNSGRKRLFSVFFTKKSEKKTVCDRNSL